MGGYNRCSLICLIVSAVFVYECCQAADPDRECESLCGVRANEDGEIMCKYYTFRGAECSCRENGAIFISKWDGCKRVNICGSPQKLPCDNSECISRKAWCDGDIDCIDASDEQYCQKQGWIGPVPDNHCTEKHFTCADGPCIPAVARCDENYDCSDWSDEEDCEETTTAASFGYSLPQSVKTSQDNTFSRYDDNDDDAYDRPLSGSTSNTTGSSITTTTSTTTVSSTTPRSSTSTVPSRFPSSIGFYDKRREKASEQPSVQRPYYQNRNNQYYPNYSGHNQNGRPYYAPNRPFVEQWPFRPSNNYNRGYDAPHTTDNYYGQSPRRTSYNGQRPHSSYPSGKGSDTAPRQFYPASQLSSLQPVYTSRTTSEAPHPLTFTAEDNSPKTTHKSHAQQQRPSQIQSRAVLHLLNPRQQYYTYQHEPTMHYREKQHDLAMKHEKELQELTMQHKIKELELNMQRKREELERIMQHKREELELILQHKREELELTMQHKRELVHIVQLRREEQELMTQSNK